MPETSARVVDNLYLVRETIVASFADRAEPVSRDLAAFFIAH